MTPTEACGDCGAHYSVRPGPGPGCPVCMVIDRCDELLAKIGALEDRPTDFRGSRITIHQTFAAADPDGVLGRVMADLATASRYETPPAPAEQSAAVERAIALGKHDEAEELRMGVTSERLKREQAEGALALSRTAERNARTELEALVANLDAIMAKLREPRG